MSQEISINDLKQITNKFQEYKTKLIDLSKETTITHSKYHALDCEVEDYITNKLNVPEYENDSFIGTFEECNEQPYIIKCERYFYIKDKVVELNIRNNLNLYKVIYNVCYNVDDLIAHLIGEDNDD